MVFWTKESIEFLEEVTRCEATHHVRRNRGNQIVIPAIFHAGEHSTVPFQPQADEWVRGLFALLATPWEHR